MRKCAQKISKWSFYEIKLIFMSIVQWTEIFKTCTCIIVYITVYRVKKKFVRFRCLIPMDLAHSMIKAHVQHFSNEENNILD